ncbi:hypothetical protein K440DRAFT_618137 [Wilcoxina mikolae CBS 423.85]|nr:hypothetical protein K440DRAFT_618137 [Wilcoxina mikolae CBS 423.85]
MKFSLATVALLAIAVSAMPQGSYGDSGNDQCKPVTVTHYKTVTQYKTKTKHVHEEPKVETKKITKMLTKTITKYGQPVTETIYKTITKTNTVYPNPPSQQNGKTYNVVVGGSKNGQPVLKYTPEYVYAQPGDVVVFDFLFKNHTVSESTFEKPCEKKMGGFESGFRPNLNNVPGTSKYQVTVQDTQPHWVYCAQGPHCSLGMVFAINPPETGNTYDQFLLKAKSTKPPAPGGPIQPPTGPTYGQPDTKDKPAPKQPYTPGPQQPASKQPTDTDNDHDNDHDNGNDKPTDMPKQPTAPTNGQPAPKKDAQDKQPATDSDNDNDNDKSTDKKPAPNQPASKQPYTPGPQQPAPQQQQPANNQPASGSDSYY